MSHRRDGEPRRTGLRARWAALLTRCHPVPQAREEEPRGPAEAAGASATPPAASNETIAAVLAATTVTTM